MNPRKKSPTQNIGGSASSTFKQDSRGTSGEPDESESEAASKRRHGSPESPPTSRSAYHPRQFSQETMAEIDVPRSSRTTGTVGHIGGPHLISENTDTSSLLLKHQQCQPLVDAEGSLHAYTHRYVLGLRRGCRLATLSPGKPRDSHVNGVKSTPLLAI